MNRSLFFLLLFTASSLSSAQWSAFHGGPQRSGRTTLLGPTTPTLRWTVDLGGPVVTSPVVASDGTIYVGTTWDNTDLKPQTSLSAINPNGTIKWQYKLPFFDAQSTSSPCLDAQGNIYFGHASGALISLNPQGQVRWKRQGALPVNAHPVAFGTDKLYAYIDNNLVSIDPANGLNRWTYPIGHNYPGGPAVGTDGTIYAVTENGVKAIHVDGTLKWQAVIGGGIAPVAVSPNGDVIVGGNFLAALDPNTGDYRFIQGGGGTVNSDVTPTVDATGNFYAMQSWSVVKYSSVGNLMWERRLETGPYLGDCHSSFALDGANRLYVAPGWYKRAAIDIEKNILCINANTGQVLWLFPMPDICSPSSPAITPDGTLVVGCTNGKLYAIR